MAGDAVTDGEDSKFTLKLSKDIKQPVNNKEYKKATVPANSIKYFLFICKMS
jgi:hypothetical protein